MSIDKTQPFFPLRIALLTISDTRTPETDRSGPMLRKLAEKDGHQIVSALIMPDDLQIISQHLSKYSSEDSIDVVICTGGTGLSPRDVTPEAFEQVVDKWIPGFGELFRMLSYQNIGTSTIQSRATAGMKGHTFLFALPGSTGACRDAWQMILHEQLDTRHKPCNFAELLPRFKVSTQQN